MSSPTAQPRAETAAAVDVVTGALRLARRGMNDAQVSYKGERDVVTTVDVAVEDMVRDRVAGLDGRPVVGEERGGEAPADGSGYWLVDPICGTRNFASGVPLYAVNLALVEGGRVTVAAVGDPSRDEILVAERGGGAWALAAGERRDLAVSAASQVVVVEAGASRGDLRGWTARFTERVIRGDRWDLRWLGTTLSLPYVAAGRVAAYVIFSLPALHSAAGILLAAEAGAVVSGRDGGPWTVTSTSLVAAATPELHRDLLALVDESRESPVPEA
jgi:myo-inositol-1(or 4)-monophosphatase